MGKIKLRTYYDYKKCREKHMDDFYSRPGLIIYIKRMKTNDVVQSCTLGICVVLSNVALKYSVNDI
jgi:hypothetical protein